MAEELINLADYAAKKGNPWFGLGNLISGSNPKQETMKYHLRIWCPDCLGEDPQGCFDGQVHEDDEEFDTPQEANKAGWKATLHNIHEYEVVDEQGNVIEVEESPWE